MKIALAQTQSHAGDIQRNLAMHLEVLEIAADAGFELVVFPELSLTGYERSPASQLADDLKDFHFPAIQALCDDRSLVAFLGLPTRAGQGTCISSIQIQPQLAPRLYSKAHLAADELDYFVPASVAPEIQPTGNLVDRPEIALAICYEISITDHASKACESGAEIYLASVAKTALGVQKAFNALSKIARQHSMLVAMSNCVGTCDCLGPSEGWRAAGRSAVWDRQGNLLAELGSDEPGLLAFDTKEHTTEAIPFRIG